MGDANDNAMPRWARDLPAGTWARVNELIDEGWGAADIGRIADLPEGKLRSLQVYVHNFGPRRRLIKFARFKDALVDHAEAFGADVVKALSILAKRTVSNETDTEELRKAIEAMNEVAKMMCKLHDADWKIEEKRQDAESGVKTVNAADVVAGILEVYGIQPGEATKRRSDGATKGGEAPPTRGDATEA